MKKTIWAVVVVAIMVLLIYFWQTRTKTYINENYGFSFKYIATYKEQYNEDTLISLQNYNASILIDVVATESTNGYTKDVSKLGIGYVNLLKIYNEDAKYNIIADETISVSNGNVQAREIMLKIDDDGKFIIERVVLIPALNREITLVVTGTEDSMSKKEKQINKIINSIKIY